MASQITSLTIVYLTVYSGADQRRHQSSASLAFPWGIHGWLVNFPHKGQWRGKCFHSMTSLCVIFILELSYNSPFHEISASWRKCILLPSAVKHSVQNGGVVWSGIRVALIWGSAQNLFLATSVIMVVLPIQRSYITDANHAFIIS